MAPTTITLEPAHALSAGVALSATLLSLYLGEMVGRARRVYKVPVRPGPPTARPSPGSAALLARPLTHVLILHSTPTCTRRPTTPPRRPLTEYSVRAGPPRAALCARLHARLHRGTHARGARHTGAHQNYLENLSSFLVYLVLGSVHYPLAAAGLGAIYLAGRVAYAQGYSTGTPTSAAAAVTAALLLMMMR
jgi:hypothetical protein